MMKIRHLISYAVASVLFWTGAFAQNEGAHWRASTNDRLYSDMLKYMGTFQNEMAGEDAYYLLQDAMMAVKAAHDEKPYQWIYQITDLCTRLEALYPAYLSHPSEGKNDRYEKVRRGIMRLMDFPMHVVSFNNSDDNIAPPAEQASAYTGAVHQNMLIRRETLFDLLASPRPTGTDVQVIKVYSSGFIVRTKDSCVAFDICYNYSYGSSERMDELVDFLDAICFTHNHNDHFDSSLAAGMVKAGKAVIMPRDFIPAYPSSKKFVWSSSRETMVDIAAGIKGSAQMSQQGADPCLLYYIDIDGWRIIHNGDNDEHGKDVFFEDREAADIIFCDTFGGLCNHLRHFLAAPNSGNVCSVYFTTHENEYHHSVYRRIGAHYTYYALDAFGNTSFEFPDYVAIDSAEMITLSK